MNTWKVYKHTNLVNGKVYIGITSRNPADRWGTNGRGYKGQSKFFNAILKYGWDNFSHEVLVDNLTEEQAYAMERELISAYDSITNGYNSAEGGGFVQCGGDNQHSREVVQKTTTGQLVAVFHTVKEAAESMHTTHQNISKACAGYTNSYGGYIWEYKNNPAKPFKHKPGKNPNSRHTKFVFMMDINGNVYKFKSVQEASSAVKVGKNSIWRWCTGQMEDQTGRRWSYNEFH